MAQFQHEAVGPTKPIGRIRVANPGWRRDGQRWQTDGTPGALSVMIDAGAFLLLRLRPEGQREGSRWIAVTAREAGPAMHALRAAAYARVAGVDSAAGVGLDGLRLPR